MAPKVDIMSLWFMAGNLQFGYSLQISDIIVDSRPAATSPPSPLCDEGGHQARGHLGRRRGSFQPKTTGEPPAKRPATMAAGGIDASLEGTVNPNAYL